MLRKIYVILGIILIIINITIFTITLGDPFLIFSEPGVFGFDPVILGLIFIGCGFIKNRLLRWFIAIPTLIMWIIISFITLMGNFSTIF